MCNSLTVCFIILLWLVKAPACDSQQFFQRSATPEFVGPKPKPSHPRGTECEEFGRNSWFNPYSVLQETWFAFYYWNSEVLDIRLRFFIPTAVELVWLQKHFEHHAREPLNWTQRVLLAEDMTDKLGLMFIEQGEHNRGLYHLYPIIKRHHEDDAVPTTVRLKQTKDNRYLGIMRCKDLAVYVLSRLEDVPPKSQIQEAASSLNYVASGGQSYLYQGHQWMPIPEHDEETYWLKVTPENIVKRLIGPD